MSEILNVLVQPTYDINIIKKEYHNYLPFLQSFNNNDEIRIAIQNQDLYVQPSESFLYIEGVITKIDGTPTTNIKLKNNCVAHLFDEIRYELNGMEIDRTRNLAISSTMKNLISMDVNESMTSLNAGWSPLEDITLANGHFNFCVPLRLLLGFAEDYNKIIMNCKHELILIRAKSDVDGFLFQNAQTKLNISNLTWKIPHINLADHMKLDLFKIIKSQRPITLSFRSWDSHFNPTLVNGSNHLWNVKLALQNERPRFLLFTFYNNATKSFTHCNLNDIKVYLNSESYPYEDLNLDFDKNRYSQLYDMYARFKQSYYVQETYPLLSRENFMNEPIIAVNLLYQNESIKTGPVDIRIELKTKKNIPSNIIAYCLILHERTLQYIPLTNEIRKVI